MFCPSNKECIYLGLRRPDQALRAKERKGNKRKRRRGREKIYIAD
jgi:hypothetical protein